MIVAFEVDPANTGGSSAHWTNVTTLEPNCLSVAGTEYNFVVPGGNGNTD